LKSIIFAKLKEPNTIRDFDGNTIELHTTTGALVAVKQPPSPFTLRETIDLLQESQQCAIPGMATKLMKLLNDRLGLPSDEWPVDKPAPAAGSEHD
jgi:hypothetical protein